MARYYLLPLFCVVLAGCHEDVTNGRQPIARTVGDSESKTQSDTITAGQDIGVVRRILTRRKIKQGIGFSVTKQHNEAYVGCVLDPDQIHACIWYSTATKKVDRIELICFPTPRHGKLSHTWIPVKKLQFSLDGSFVATFPSPRRKTTTKEKTAEELLPEADVPSGPGREAFDDGSDDPFHFDPPSKRNAKEP